MKDFKFYAEMESERKSKSGCKGCRPFTRATLQQAADTGFHHNCIAVPLENGKPLYQGSTTNFDAVGANSDRSNGGAALTSTTHGYLRDRCVLVSEELARRLHPNLFTYLEADHG